MLIRLYYQPRPWLLRQLNNIIIIIIIIIIDKYKCLHSDLHKSYNNYILTLFTVEVRVLGFISNLSDFFQYLNYYSLTKH